MKGAPVGAPFSILVMSLSDLANLAANNYIITFGVNPLNQHSTANVTIACYLLNNMLYL